MDLIGTLKNPFVFALGVYIALLPFDSLLSVTATQGSGDTATKFLGIFCIFVLVVKGAVEHRLVKPDNSAFWWFAFMVFAMTTTLWAPVSGSFSAIIGHFGLILLYLTACVYAPTEKDLGYLKAAIFCGGVIAALYIIFTYSADNFSGRATVAYGNRYADPNELVFSLSFSFGVCLSYLTTAKRQATKNLAILFLGILAYAVVLTGSRGGLIGVLSIASVFVFYSKKKSRLVFAVLAVSAVALYSAPDLFFERIMSAESGKTHGWTSGV